MRRIVIFFIVFYSTLKGYGQGIADFDKIVPTTPEAAHLQKGIAIPVDYGTGIPNISIPLFDLKTGNISVPISLSYHASGIKVGQLSSSVGLGWGLNAGGGVQRSIRGRSDDMSSLWASCTNHFTDSIMNGTIEANDYMLGNSGDFTQDDYSFSFLGYGGSFYFDSTRTIRNVIANPISLEYIYPGNTKFIAKDYSGYTYYFDQRDFSSSVSYPSDNGLNSNLTGGTSAWKLTKIKYQGIDSVQLSYERDTVFYEEEGADVYDAKIMLLNCLPGSGECETCPDDYTSKMYRMISYRYFESSLIKQIISRDTKVDFYYSDNTSAAVWERKLDSILVTSLVDSLIKKKFIFTYSLFGGCDQLKLNAVRKVDLNTGTFEETKFLYYEHSSISLPAIGSRSKDLFGYFNNASNQYLIVSNDAVYSGVFDNADRSVNAEMIKLGTLRSITYSTGGFSEFMYEANKINDSMYGPGLRVKEVREYNAVDSNLIRTGYEYYGYHGQWVEYPYSMPPHVQMGTYLRKIFSSDEPYSYNIPKGVIPSGYIYDSVIVKAKGNTHNLVTNYKYNYMTIYNGYRGDLKETDYYAYNAALSSYKLIRKDRTYYNYSVNQDHITPLFGVELPEYMDLISFTNSSNTCYNVTGGFITQYTYSENSIFKTKEQNTVYQNENPITTEARYYYQSNDPSRPTRIVKLNSTDSTITTIKYPQEMVSGSLDPNGVYQSMINDHFWGPGIIEETLDAASSSLTKSITEFKQWTGFIAPELLKIGTLGTSPETRKKINQYDQYGNISEYETDGMKNCFLWDYNNCLPVAKVANASVTEVAYSGFETSQTGGWTFSGGSYSTSCAITGKKSYSLSGGNSITKSGLSSQDYIVSYWLKTGSLSVNSGGGTAGMAKNGWTYYEHELTSATSITVSGTATFDDLRLYPKKSQMATYAFDPLKGVIAMVDVSNRIAYYEYDGMGRLYLIRDIDKNILKKINYNLSQTGSIYYNELQSGDFTKQNCPSGSEGVLLTYVVPAGRYSSNISQEDADAQALLEVTNLGQSYANQYGTCVLTCSPSCTLGKRCINGLCVRGTKIYTASVYNSITGMYDCTYHLEWEDGFQTADSYEESSTPCIF